MNYAACPRLLRLTSGTHRVESDSLPGTQPTELSNQHYFSYQSFLPLYTSCWKMWAGMCCCRRAVFVGFPRDVWLSAVGNRKLVMKAFGLIWHALSSSGQQGLTASAADRVRGQLPSCPQPERGSHPVLSALSGNCFPKRRARNYLLTGDNA